MDGAGINSAAFERVWMSYDTPEKQQELLDDLMHYMWEKNYQPTFTHLATLGYPKISYDNYRNPDNFGYSAAVISCLGQSSRQTGEIFAAAKQRADKAAGGTASLDDYIDTSYDIRHEKWGLTTRYYGKDGVSGEKAFNQQLREAFAKHKTFTLSQAEIENLRTMFDREFILENDATKLPQGDSLHMQNEILRMKRINDSTAQQTEADIMPVSLPDNFPEILQSIRDDSNLFVPGAEGLVEQHDKLNAELADLNAQLQDMSSDIYTSMGRKLNVDYGKIKPETVGHVYESALDPTMKDAANSALGLYQFNLNNTMKLLADDFADEFPALQEAKKSFGVKSKQYAQVWKQYSTGSTKERFEQRQLEFMWRIAYQPAFDKMTKSCGLPKITLENYNNKEHRVYAASMMSLVNQSPRKSTKFMEQAYNRVARHLTSGKPDPNQVGLVSYDVRDEAWGRKNRALHRRYMGGQGVIGEKELCENMLRYDREAPQMMARIANVQNMLNSVDYALNTMRKVPGVGADMPKHPQEIASNDALKERMDKVVAIQKHARNIKELRQLRSRVRHNLAKVIADENTQENTQSAQISGRGGNNDGSRRA